MVNYSNKEECRQSYEQRLKDPDTLRMFMEECTGLDSWLLYSEALPFCQGVDHREWSQVRELHLDWQAQVIRLIKASIGTSLKVINPEAEDGGLRVKPKVFVQWLHSKGIRPHSELEVVLAMAYSAEKKSKDEKYSKHGNAEFHAQRREKVLAAAIAVMAAVPEKCKRDGEFSGSTIAEQIDVFSTQVYGIGEDAPLGSRKVTEIISKALKLIPDK
jgi:hypothetical protein